MNVYWIHKVSSQILAFTKAPWYQTAHSALLNKYVSNGTWSIERFVGLESSILMWSSDANHRPRSWDKRKWGRGACSQGVEDSVLEILALHFKNKGRISLKHHLVHSKIPSFHKDLLVIFDQVAKCRGYPHSNFFKFFYWSIVAL